MGSQSFHFASRAALCTFALAVLAFPAAAQVSSTSLRGQVRDPSGALIPGATLTVKDAATGLERSTKSGADGSFTFTNLQAGKFDLTVVAAGFQNGVYKSIAVDSGRTTDVPVELKVGTANQSVEVQTSGIQLETTSNEVGATISSKLIQDLPYASRDTLGFALLAPGAQSSDSDRDSTFNGLPNASLNLSVDGMNNNSQRFKTGGTSFFEFAPSRLAAMEQITVSTGGLGAEAAGGGAMQIRFTTRRVFDPATGDWRGGLKADTGGPLKIDGLWGLRVGNGGSGGDRDKVFFTAGPDGESHGLFGSLTPAPPVGDDSGD